MLLVSKRGYRLSRYELSYISNEIIIEKGASSNYALKLPGRSSSDPAENGIRSGYEHCPEFALHYYQC